MVDPATVLLTLGQLAELIGEVAAAHAKAKAGELTDDDWKQLNVGLDQANREWDDA